MQGYLLTDTAVLKKKKGKPYIDVEFLQVVDGKEGAEQLSGPRFQEVAGRASAKKWRETVKMSGMYSASGKAQKTADQWLREHAADWVRDAKLDFTLVSSWGLLIS
eukprot:scaffold8007_cov19-Tisochrysis_lutea.AAC.4